jgi:glycerol-3-phosphate dehydrogenase
LRFVMPQVTGQRPAWLLRTGLFLYDHLTRRGFLPGSESLDLHSHPAGQALKAEFSRGFAYSDGWVDDARLVVLNAVDARERGASILTRSRCSAVLRHPRHWEATLVHEGGHTLVEARCLVNAAGPWAARFLHGVAGLLHAPALRLVKGSHIVVPRLFDHAQAYLFQHSDGRVVFALPYEGDFTLIGTTDLDYRGDLDELSASPEEVAYLCELANRYFRRQVSPSDVAWSFAGVRPLLGDAAGSAAAATRDFRLATDRTGAPLLSVLGGKITTSRVLAEQVVDWIAPVLGVRARHWTANACLPGGDLFGERPSPRAVLEFDRWLGDQQLHYPWLPTALLVRYGRAYGTRMNCMLDGRRAMGELGEELAPGLHAAEVDYLARYEWARCADDVLWRRTKLGLHVASGSRERIDAWMAARQPALV